MTLRALIALAVLFPTAALAQPATVDSLPPLPAFRIGTQTDFQPLHTSKTRAYLYSIAATAGMVVLGVATNEVIRSIDPVAYRDNGRYITGYVIAGTGLVLGPAVGNWTLGAVEDANRAGRVKAIALVTAAGLVTIGFLGTATTAVTGSPDGVSTLMPLTYAALGVALVGTLAGGAMDLASIPQNARDAQRRQRRPATATVSAGMTPSGPGLAVRVGL